MPSVIADTTIVGRVISKLDLKTFGEDNDRHVIRFRVAVTPRRYNKKNEEWEDKNTLVKNAQAWGRLAKNFDESFEPGDRIILIGHEEQGDDYEKDGEEVEGQPVVVADHIGPEITYDAAHTERERKNKGSKSSSKSSSSKSSSSSSSKKSSAKKPKEENLDDDLDLDDDFGDDEPDF